MSKITKKKITIKYESTTELRDIDVDTTRSWYTCQTWFDETLKDDFLKGKLGDNIRITWYDGRHLDFKRK